MAGAAAEGEGISEIDLRACLLPALLAEPETAGELEVVVRLSSHAITGVAVPWAPVQSCLSRRLVGRELESSKPVFGFLASTTPPPTEWTTARIAVTLESP